MTSRDRTAQMLASPTHHLGVFLDFIQYVPGSKQTALRGKLLDPSRLSTHIWHVGILTEDRQAGPSFYREKLGFGRRLPGGRDEYIETPVSDRNTETKYPRLDPNDPATREQFVRENDGAVNHMSLEITDIRVARDLARKRGNYMHLRVRATMGNSRHWLVHLFDPDGSRTELMETALNDPAVIPANSVMAPGGASAADQADDARRNPVAGIAG